MQPVGSDDPADSRSSSADRAFSVAGWSVDPTTLRISKDGRITKLEPLTMAVLMHLAARNGKTVSREELEREIWPGQVVVYQALSNAIAKLRKAFDDDPSRPIVIETIPKVGYRLVAEVRGSGTQVARAASEHAPSQRPRGAMRRRVWVGVTVVIGGLAVVALLWSALWRAPHESEISQPSIAVLPFKNMSGDPGQEYFADGMTEDLITDLSKVSGVFVLARSSTFGYKEKPVDISQIYRELGADYVLEGSVRRAGNRIRVNAQLIDAESGGHVWADRYDSSMSDIFALQDQVTRNVVSALAVHLTPEERQARPRPETDDPEAYDAFLRAWARYKLWTPGDFIEAIAHLENSIRLDPGYARAHGLLASIYYHTSSNGWMESLDIRNDETIEKLEHHLNVAMKNPTSLTHQTASRYYASLGRHDDALWHAKRSIVVDPNDGMAYIALARILNRHDRPAEGLAAVRMAAKLDPKGNDRGSYSYRMGESYFHMGQFDRAAEEFKRFTKVNPADEWGFLYLAATYGHLGDKQAAEDAMAEFEKRRAAKGRRPYTLAQMDSWHFPNPDVRERFRDGLRKAGLPPGASASREYPIDKPPPEIEGAETIDAAKALALLERSVPFVDVRKDPDWKRGRIPGAVHLHLYADFSESNLAELAAKDDEIVIYADGLHTGRSTTAVMRALSWGYEKIYFFRGGFPAWKAAGFTVELDSG